MPLTRTKSSSTVPARTARRPELPRWALSSLLRLAQPESKRLPGTLDLAEWASRAAAVLMPVDRPAQQFRGKRIRLRRGPLIER